MASAGGNYKNKDGVEWTRVAADSMQDETRAPKDAFLDLSNPSVPLPLGLWSVADFVTEEQETTILREIEGNKFHWEGFDQQRRVQRYQLRDHCQDTIPASDDDNDKDDSTTTPASLLDLKDRLEKFTGRRVGDVVIQEYSKLKWEISGEYASNHVVATFESSNLCQCRMRPVVDEDNSKNNNNNNDDCSCLVAQIPLRKSAIQHLNRPQRRDANCWTLETPNHWTDVHMKQRSLLVKTDDCLENWRTRVSAGQESPDSVLVLKFYSLPVSSGSENKTAHQEGDNIFGYVPSDQDQIRRSSVAPPLEDMLTIIVTTSPIKSNPSTEVIERTLETFIQAGPDFAYKCRKVFVCDGVRRQDDGTKVSRKHSNVKQSMRNGIVNSDQADSYQQFKNILRELCASASETSPFFNGVVEELETRHGYGFALRHALMHCVDTPFVCVIQHDRTFMRPTPINETVEAMWKNPNIKYVGMSQRSNLMYKDIFLSKYGKHAGNEWNEMVQLVPELSLDAAKYGPDSESTSAMTYPTEKLKENMRLLAETYRKSAQYVDLQETLEQHPVEPGQHQLTLTPTLFWYDNTHICDTAHYRDFVFHPSYKMVAKGGFVEDKLSPVLKRTVERLGLKDGHSRFGCYLLDDRSGMFFTGHLDGGSYMTAADRKELLESQSSSAST
jgi:hypothetical protein